VVDALARRDLTSDELAGRLARAGFDPAVSADAIARAREAGYLDDARAAVERTRVLADRGASDEAIRLELERRGVTAEAIDAALESVSPELDRAERLARKAGGGPRAARALARKGYPQEVIERVLGLPVAE
jgi:SOS response regulatory protein OraA/RecX